MYYAHLKVASIARLEVKRHSLEKLTKKNHIARNCCCKKRGTN